MQNWQAGWPRQDYLELTAVTEAVPSARYHTRLVMREWRAESFGMGIGVAGGCGGARRAGESQLAEDVEQVTAELVANAVAATRAVAWMPWQPPVRLWLLGDGDQAMVVVWDGTTTAPVLRRPDWDEESGRGLLLVDALAHWGYYLAPASYGGKIVYARLPKDVPLATRASADPDITDSFPVAETFPCPDEEIFP
jgi:hypothetical protein